MKHVIYLELKKVRVPLLVFMLLSYVGMNVVWRRDQSVYTLQLYNRFYYMFAHAGMVFCIAKIYLQDFKLRTIRQLKVLSSSKRKLNRIRMCNAMAIGFVFFVGSFIVMNRSLHILNKFTYVVFSAKDAFSVLGIYLIVSVLIALYVNFIGYLFKDVKLAYQIAVLLPLISNQLIPLAVLSESSMSKVMNLVVQNSPSAILFRLTSSWVMGIREICLLGFWAIVLYCLQQWLEKKRDLK